MKAAPELPTVSAGEVARIGAAAAAPALERVPRRGGVQIPIEVRPGADGVALLVHATTGDVLGRCASAAVAERTRNFFR